MKHEKINLLLSIFQLILWAIMGIVVFIFQAPITTFNFVIMWLCLVLNIIQNILYEYSASKGLK